MSSDSHDLKYLDLHNNCYDLIRLVLAAIVIYSHSYVIGGFGNEPLIEISKEGIHSGSVCVMAFFGLSGFLICASFDRSKSVFSFLMKRCRRILPGYWLCLIVTSFVLAPVIWMLDDKSIHDYPFIQSVYFFKNNLFLHIRQWTVAGLQSGADSNLVINGSLWSLFPEFLCYLGVVMLGMAGSFTGSRWLLVSATTYVYANHVLLQFTGKDVGAGIPYMCSHSIWSPFLASFLMGSCCYVWRNKFQFSWKTLAICLLIAALTICHGGFRLLAPALVTAITLMFGAMKTVRLRHDYSFGLYIFSYPAQITIHKLGWFNQSFILFLASSLALSLGLAYISWHIVEQRFLRKQAQ